MAVTTRSALVLRAMIPVIHRVLFAGFVLGACGGGSKSAAQEPVGTSDGQALSNTQPPAPEPAPPPTPAQRAMAKMEELAGKMCACKEAECAKSVSNEMTRWSQEMANEVKNEPVKMSEEDMKRATEIGTRMGECMQKAMEAGGP